MSTRANTTNTLGTSQVSGGNVATPQTYVTTFPRASGAAMTALVTRQGTTAGNPVERDSDGGFWDTTAGVPVSADNVSLGINNMAS